MNEKPSPALIQTIVQTMLSFAQMGIAVGILMAFVGYFSRAATMRALHETDSGQKISFFEPYSFALKRLGAAILLSIRIFFYILKWMLIPIGGFIALAIYAGTLRNNTGAGILTVGMIAFVISFLVLYIIKVCQVAFAFPLLFSSAVMTSRVALHKSITLAKGICGRIFLNYLLTFLIVFLIGAVYGALVAPLTPPPKNILQEYGQNNESMQLLPALLENQANENLPGERNLGKGTDKAALRNQFNQSMMQIFQQAAVILYVCFC